MRRRSLTVLMDEPNMRQCGDCSLCCTVMAVSEIAKPGNCRCDKLTTLGRCSVYNTKPQSCTEFKCLWLQGMMPEDLKPSRSRVVGAVNGDGTIVVLHVSPFDKGAWRKGPVQDWIRSVGEHLMVVVACGSERYFFGKDADKKLHVLIDKNEPDMWQIMMELDDEGRPVIVGRTTPSKEN